MRLFWAGRCLLDLDIAANPVSLSGTRLAFQWFRGSVVQWLSGSASQPFCLPAVLTPKV